jgi:putrescine aminotransferase
MRAVRDTMVFSPPLTITDAEIDDLVARATTAIMATQADVRSEIL